MSRVWDLLSCSNDSLNVIAASFLVALAAVAASATPKEEGREYYSLLQGDRAAHGLSFIATLVECCAA